MTTEPVKEVIPGSTALNAGVAAAEAFAKAVKNDYQHLAKVISGKETVKEAVKGYQHPLMEAGKAVGETVVENHKRNVEVIKNIFSK